MGGCTGAWLQETKPQLPSCACDSWVLDEANMKPHPPPAGTIGVAFWDKLSSLSVLWGVLSERGSKQVLSHTSMATSRSVVRWAGQQLAPLGFQVKFLCSFLTPVPATGSLPFVPSCGACAGCTPLPQRSDAKKPITASQANLQTPKGQLLVSYSKRTVCTLLVLLKSLLQSSRPRGLLPHQPKYLWGGMWFDGIWFHV